MTSGVASRRLAGMLAAAIIAVTLLNGLGPYLRRIGVLQPERHAAFWTVHCADGRTTSRILGMGETCLVPNHTVSALELARRERPFVEYVHQMTPSEWPAKAAKDVLAVALVSTGLIAGARASAGRALLTRAWPASALLSLVLVAAGASMVRHGAWVAVAGLRSFAFLPMAFAAAILRLPESLGPIAGGMRGLMMIQLVLAVPELVYGLPMYVTAPADTLPKRLAGSLVLPNSLGVFAVVALAFIASFAMRGRAAAIVAALLLVAAAGSATGFVVLSVLAGAAVIQRVRPRHRLLVGFILALGAAVMVPMLPVIVGRPVLFDGLFSDKGRVPRLMDALSGTWPEVLLGQGLGVGTNAAANLRPEVLAGMTPLVAAPVSLVSDSTVTLLVRGTGVLGVALFYGMLVWAWRRDRRARLFYLGLAVSSATMNVTELFPVSVLLALALSHSFSAPLPSPGPLGLDPNGESPAR